MTDRERIIKAVDRLAAALAELGYTDRISIRPDVRLLLTPENPTSREIRSMHALGLTPELAELAAEAIEQLTARRTVGHLPNAKPELTSEVNSVFASLDLREITREVLDTTTPNNRTTVTRALNDMFGDVIDPEAEADE
jgi:hypothetical protein